MPDREDLAAKVAERLDRVNYARFFGFEVVEARFGAVTLALEHRAEFEHAPGWFEGTITSAIGQIAASYSGMTASDIGWAHQVLDQTVRFIGEARGERLVAVGKVAKAGRSISFTAADIFVERDGQRYLCAEVVMTMQHRPPRD